MSSDASAPETTEMHLMGWLMAHDTTFKWLMRAIAAGLTGDEAYRHVADGLEQEAAALDGIAMPQAAHARMRLRATAATFRG